LGWTNRRVRRAVFTDQYNVKKVSKNTYAWRRVDEAFSHK
jgi:hypothetical protein